MKQYLVLLSIGTYEGTSCSVIPLYYLSEDEKNPTEIANVVKANFDLYYNDIASKRDKRLEFINLFNLELHEVDFLDSFVNFDCCPYDDFPITDIIYLTGMEDYVDEKEMWLFQEEQLRNGQVSSEVFWSVNVNNPRL